MGAVQLSDEIQSMIERQIEEGRATSMGAFLEEAVLRLVDDARSEEEEATRAAKAGIADVEAGHYATVVGPDDNRLLHERMMARLREGLAAEK